MAHGVELEGFEAMPNGALYTERLTGQGVSVRKGDTVTVHVSLWISEAGQRGQKIVDSRTENRTLSFVVGAEYMLPGLSQGVVGMQSGGQRTLLLPPNIAYGDKGLPGVVPVNTDVLLEVELLDITARR